MMAEAEARFLAGLIKVIKMNSRGWIEAIEAISEDGMPIAHESDEEKFNPEYIAAAVAAICGAITAVIELMSAKGYKRVSIQLEDKRYILVREYRKHYIVCLTKPDPNLGFIEILMEAYLAG